ncbi:UNVERIFIED_ORG: hypothetical protein ABIB52_000292 [Arthrobacter sp. UYCu721]
MINNPSPAASPKRRWKPSVLFWIVAALVLLVMIPFVAAGGVGMAVFILGLVAILTGLYVLLFKRRSWVGLPHRKSGGIVAASGVIALIVGAGVVGATAAPRDDSDKAALVSPVQQSATATATPTPTPSATSPANSSCLTVAETRKYNDKSFICTLGSDQKLVWMTEADSKRVVAEKAAAEKATAEKVAAAEKAAADKAAADQAAEKLAAEQAAAQQAAKPAPAPAAPAAPAPAPAAAYYKNCDAVRAAGAAPLYANQPGFRAALDRNNNGVACED